MDTRTIRRMSLEEIVSRFPRAVEVMVKHGLPCFRCSAASWESLEEGAGSHGMGEEEIEGLAREIIGVSGSKI